MFCQRKFYFSKMFRQRKFYFSKMFRQRKFYPHKKNSAAKYTTAELIIFCS